MNGTVEVRTYAEQLRDELVQAATRQHRARRRRRAVVGAGAGAVALAGVIALLVGLLVSPSEDPASAEGTVRVVREDQSTLVEIVDIDRPDEVADALGCTTGAARVRSSRALARLRAAVDEEPERIAGSA